MDIQVYGELVSVVYQISALDGLPDTTYWILIAATLVGPDVGPVTVAVVPARVMKYLYVSPMRSFPAGSVKP